MMGADLLVIKDQEQQEFILRTIRQRGDDTYWIGLQRDGDGWRWVDGEHYNSSLFQIKTRSLGRCVSMSRSGYYQTSCNSTNRWICLKKAVKI
ncbi:killer cell lectin-like receptor subfamily B member 1B allele A [Rhinoderma darwinii]|uniref:killer cell lectin-like receptor subfamily B member 1B allele A n=1 Tax=Rhinoderma darwinii TaxID=43563 RepID=UPI003F66C89F